jgi:nucleotide-binding universal stress UspA family protein
MAAVPFERILVPGWSRVVAGSVTAAVLRDVALPVLVVPGPLDR